MSAPRSWSRSLGTAFLFLAALTAGCSSKDSSTAPSTNEADQLVAQANAKLGDALFAEINGPEPSRPSDINLQEPYALYQQALVKDPSNRQANFGVAVLGLLSLSYDPEVNAAFDEWQAYLQSRTPFEARAGRGRSLGVPLLFADGASSMRLPFELVPLSAIAQVRGPLGTADPQISRVQAILRDRVLPRLTEAALRLHTAAAQPFLFTVTPHMQGDDDADPIEIDNTDLLALSAACELLSSACHVAVAYNLNFAAYDSAGLYTAVQQGSPWLALASGGAAHMSGAGTSLSDALVDLDAAIASLRAETDPQDDDAIRRGPDDLSLADLDSLHTYVGRVQTSMGAGFSLNADWNGDGVESPLTIHLAQFFSNPIPDWKSEVPGYTVSVVRRPRDFDYVSNYSAPGVSVNAPGAMTYYYSYTISVSDHGTPSTYESGDSFLQTAVTQLVLDSYAQVAAMPRWSGDYYGSAGVYGSTPAGGPITVTVNLSENYRLVATEGFVPVIHWNAATFDEWVWPDPSFHGLLPDMASSAQLLSTFGIDADDWSPDLELDATVGRPSPAWLARDVPRGGATLAVRRSLPRPIATLRSRR